MSVTRNTPRLSLEAERRAAYVASGKSPAHHAPSGASNSTRASLSPGSAPEKSHRRTPSRVVPTVSSVASSAMRNVA